MGPSVNSLENICRLIDAGMNVARLNFSHGTHEEHLTVINRIKEARDKLKKPVAIMLDTKGPEIRLRKIKDDQVFLETGHLWKLVKENIMGDEQRVTITPDLVLDKLRPGMRVLFDDGYICSTVVDIMEDGVVVEIENGGIVHSGKGVNIPNTSLGLPAFSEKDAEDIRFGCHHGIDLIAASFVRSVDHVLEIKKLLYEEKKTKVLVIAKIENSEGVNNFDSIVQVADGIMIARGDLGVEVPLSEVPKLQKMMIRKAYLAGKPVVTATQMLESMIQNPRPTRAEVSDVANAIYDSTSAVMLSGETAIGKHPFAAVQMMKTVVKEAEQDIDYRQFFDLHSGLIYHDVPSSLTLAAVKTAYSSNAKAIFAFTSSGATARLLSRLRPKMPIIAMTPHEWCYRQLIFEWGVIPLLGKECASIDEAFKILSDYAIDHKLVSEGDLVVVTGGSPFGISGTTNTMLVESIGDVLVRGTGGSGKEVKGHVAFALSPEARRPYTVNGNLLILTKCDSHYYPLMHESLGIILQNLIEDTESEVCLKEYAEKHNKPYILRADGAVSVLKEGQYVKLSPSKGLVYKGAS